MPKEPTDDVVWHLICYLPPPYQMHVAPCKCPNLITVSQLSILNSPISTLFNSSFNCLVTLPGTSLHPKNPNFRWRSCFYSRGKQHQLDRIRYEFLDRNFCGAKKMQGLAVQVPQVLAASNKGTNYKKKRKLPFSPFLGSLPFSPRGLVSPASSSSSSSSSLPSLTQCRWISRSLVRHKTVTTHASGVGVGSGGFEGSQENNQNIYSTGPSSDNSSEIERRPNQIPYPLAIAIVLCGCALVFSLIAFIKGSPSAVLSAIAKSGFTAAFSLIFVSEIGDKTFFIAALLAMQYEKLLVLLGSMVALSLMSVLSVIIGRVFNSVPAQFQTTIPIGEYAAVTLLMFFGLKSIKDAWDIPSDTAKTGEKSSNELGEFVEAEELVKEKASKRLTNPLEILWKSFSLVFFAEWGDRSMLATIALGAAQSPWGVAIGAIVGHLVATTLAILGGAFLARYISEKLVGYLGGALFIVFAVATFFGAF